MRTFAAMLFAAVLGAAISWSITVSADPTLPPCAAEDAAAHPALSGPCHWNDGTGHAYLVHEGEVYFDVDESDLP